MSIIPIQIWCPRHLRAPRRQRRGIAAFLSLLFLSLLSVLALGIYSTTSLSAQVVATEQRVSLAQLAAESGMELIRQQLASVSIPYNVAPDDLFAQLALDLQTQLDTTATLSGQRIELDIANHGIHIPARDQPAISLGNGAGAFRAFVQSVGTQVTVKTTGLDPNGEYKRDIQLDYGIAMRASNIFDFGVASKGPITMNGNVSIMGTAGNELNGSVLVVSDNNTVPLTMIGSSEISGDVSLTRTNPQSISLSGSSTIAGYGTGSSNLWQHVHAQVNEPEFPVVDTTAFKAYAVNVIDGSTGSTSLVGGAGDAAGFIGLTYINISGSSLVQGFDAVNSPTLGSVTALGQTNASGNLNNMTFKGELNYRTPFSMNAATVTKLKKVNSTLTFKAPTTPADAIHKGNYNGPSGGKDTFAGGKYSFSSFTVPNGKTVEFTGPAELYISGACSITGDVVAKNDFAGNVMIRMVSSGGVDINGHGSSSPLYVDVYAPQSPLNINNRRNIHGSFIANGINMSNATVNVDRAVKANGGATATPPAQQGSVSADSTTNVSGKSFKNILIKANTNPKFTAQTQIDGVVYIEFPNRVEFGGGTTINGIVVVQTDGNNNIGLDPTKNTISFTGNVSATPLANLPATSDFPPQLRTLSGAFLLAPGFGASFGGNFGTISGSMVASKLDFHGNAGGVVMGSVINLNNTPFTMSGNSDIIIQSKGTGAYPAGVFFGSRFDPLPDTYVEVQQ